MGIKGKKKKDVMESKGECNKRLTDIIEPIEEATTQKVGFLVEVIVLKLIYFRKNGTDNRPIKPPRVSISLGNLRTHRKLIEKK